MDASRPPALLTNPFPPRLRPAPPPARARTHTPNAPPAQVRAPTHIICTISDDRGEEPTYGGVTMSELMEQDANVGEAIG